LDYITKKKSLSPMTNEVKENVEIFNSGQSLHDLWNRQWRNHK